MIKKETMKNVSFPIYQRTRERYLEFKKEKDLTHDEAINKLIDIYEQEEKEDDRKRNLERRCGL